MSFGEIIDGSLAIYREGFGTLVSIAIACHPVLWLVAMFLASIGNLVATGATVWVISEIYLGREPDFGDAISYAFGKIVRIIIAGLAKGILVFLASILLLVPGIIVWCGYSVVTQVVVLERLPSSLDSLGRSWDLTKGNKGKAFALVLVVSLLLGLPLMVGGALAAFVPALYETVTIGGQILQLMLYPIMACAFTLFYYDLRVRKEAFDLEHLSQQIGLGEETAGV
jgi:uncharacterized membrane protein